MNKEIIKNKINTPTGEFITMLIVGIVFSIILVIGINVIQRNKYSIILKPEDYSILDINEDYRTSISTGASIKVNIVITYDIAYNINGKSYKSSVEIINLDKAKKINKSSYPEKELGLIGVNPKKPERCILLDKKK